MRAAQEGDTVLLPPDEWSDDHAAALNIICGAKTMTTKTEQVLSFVENMGGTSFEDAMDNYGKTVTQIVGALSAMQDLSDNATNKLLEKMDEETVAEIFNSTAAILVYAMLVNEGMVEPLTFLLKDQAQFNYFVHTLCVTTIGMLLEEGVLK